MTKIVDYDTEESKSQIIADMEARGYKIIEYQDHFDGKHLVFEEPVRNLPSEIDDLKARVQALEAKELS